MSHPLRVRQLALLPIVMRTHDIHGYNYTLRPHATQGATAPPSRRSCGAHNVVGAADRP